MSYTDALTISQWAVRCARAEAELAVLQEKMSHTLRLNEALLHVTASPVRSNVNLSGLSTNSVQSIQHGKIYELGCSEAITQEAAKMSVTHGSAHERLRESVENRLLQVARQMIRTEFSFDDKCRAHVARAHILLGEIITPVNKKDKS